MAERHFGHIIETRGRRRYCVTCRVELAPTTPEPEPNVVPECTACDNPHECGDDCGEAYRAARPETVSEDAHSDAAYLELIADSLKGSGYEVYPYVLCEIAARLHTPAEPEGYVVLMEDQRRPQRMPDAVIFQGGIVATEDEARQMLDLLAAVAPHFKGAIHPVGPALTEESES